MYLRTELDAFYYYRVVYGVSVRTSNLLFQRYSVPSSPTYKQPNLHSSGIDVFTPIHHSPVNINVNIDAVDVPYATRRMDQSLEPLASFMYAKRPFPLSRVYGTNNYNVPSLSNNEKFTTLSSSHIKAFSFSAAVHAWRLSHLKISKAQEAKLLVQRWCRALVHLK